MYQRCVFDNIIPVCQWYMRVNQVCSKLLYSDCESTKYAQSSFTPTASQPSMLKAPLRRRRVNQVCSKLLYSNCESTKYLRCQRKIFEGQRPSRCTKRNSVTNLVSRSRTSFTNLVHESRSRISFTNLVHEPHSRISFTNLVHSNIIGTLK